MAKFELTLRRMVTQKTTVVVDMPDGRTDVAAFYYSKPQPADMNWQEELSTDLSYDVRPIDEPVAPAAEPEVLA